MSIIPCATNPELQVLIKRYVEVLKTEAHNLGDHGLSEEQFYKSGLFRGAIESIRGEFSATMRSKREFFNEVLNHMQDKGFIKEWESSGSSNRHDYTVNLNSGRIAVIELKGCLDGNNTNIFDRPANAHEFVIWSLCTNVASNPKKSVWSGIHTRLSAEIITREERVDGLIVWDMLCGTIDRPCPKLHHDPSRVTEVGQYVTPPPCIYVFPATIPSPRNNPHPKAQRLEDVELLLAFQNCFGGKTDEINYVDFEVEHREQETERLTRVTRGNITVKQSELTSIKRK
jgi:hypothetical protein